MNIAGFPNSSAASDWRLRAPFKYLTRLGHDARVVEGGITEEVAAWADLYVLKGTVDRDGLALLYAYQQEQGKKIVIDLDDAIEVDGDNPFRIDHDLTGAAAVIRRTIQIADLVTVATTPLARQVRPLNPTVALLPNSMDLEVWQRPRQVNTSDTIRIGWAGSTTHLEDLRLIAEPLQRLAAQYPQIRLILVGDTRAAALFPGCRVESVLGVPFDVWPSRLAGLRLDIGLAPLRDTPFNRCKSNIKFLEYAINHIPGVYSPTVYNFRGFDGTFGMIAATPEQWQRSIENLILSPHLREDLASHAQSFVVHKYSLGHSPNSRACTAHLWDRAYRSIATTGK